MRLLRAALAMTRMTVIHRVKRHPILLAILALALGLRVWGVGYGLPLFTQGDEPSLVSGSLRMLQYRTLVPALHPDAFRPLYYPPVIPYLLLPVIVPTLAVQYLLGDYASFGEFSRLVALHLTPVWVVSRLLIALMGVATVAVVYRLGERLFNRTAGRWAAALLATSFLHVSLSHFVRHWVPATLAFSLIMLSAVEIYRAPSRRWYLLGGVFAGLAFGVSYITVVGVVALLFAHAFGGGNIRRLLRDPRPWQSAGIFAGLSGLFVALHPQEFWRILLGEDSTAKVAKSLAGLLAEYGYHLRNLFNLEPGLLILAGIGILLLLLRRRWREASLIFVVPFVYIAVLYFFFHSEVRYISMVLPLFAVAGGYAVAAVAARCPSPLVIATLAVAALGYPLAVAIRYDRLLTIPDTRQQAAAWVAGAVSPTNPIATWFTTFTLTPSKYSILRQADLNPATLREQDRALLATPDPRYPKPAYNLLRMNLVASSLPGDWYALIDEQRYDYLAIERWNQQTDDERLAPLQMRISSGVAEPVAHFPQTVDDPNGNMDEPVFRLFFTSALGPAVTVYRLHREL